MYLRPIRHRRFCVIVIGCTVASVEGDDNSDIDSRAAQTAYPESEGRPNNMLCGGWFDALVSEMSSLPGTKSFTS